MTDLFKQAGFEVVVASVSGESMVAKTKTLKPDLKLSDVRVSDYAGFIIPCLCVAKSNPKIHADEAEAIKEAVAEAKPLLHREKVLYTWVRRESCLARNTLTQD